MPAPNAVINVATLLGCDDLVDARSLDVEDLALQRQDRLVLAVAALLGGAAGGIALYEVELAQRGIAFLAIGQLAGQPDAVQHALAARELACLARCFARTRGLHDLGADDLGIAGLFHQEFSELLPDDFRYTGITSDDTSRSLVCDENFGSGTFTDSTQVNPSRMSSPVVSTFAFLAISSLSM